MLLVKETTGNTPAALQNQPKLSKKEQYYFSAFNDLSSSRPPGDAVSAIPTSEYLAYFKLWGIDNLDERETLRMYVSALDHEYIDFVVKKMESQRNSAR